MCLMSLGLEPDVLQIADAARRAISSGRRALSAVSDDLEGERDMSFPLRIERFSMEINEKSKKIVEI